MQPDDVVGPPEIGQRLRQRARHVALGVAKRGEHEHARVPGCARQMAQQEQRGRIGPVRVLENEKRRLPTGDSGEELGDGGVQPVTFGVRVGPDRRRELAESRRQVGEEARELAAARAERPAQLVGIGGSREVVERFDERPVRRAHDGVARAVEDERAVAGGLGGELPHEPALARPRLAAEQDDPAPFPFGPRHQGAERLELARAPDERERRGESKRAGQVGHGSRRDDSQI